MCLQVVCCCEAADKSKGDNDQKDQMLRKIRWVSFCDNCAVGFDAWLFCELGGVTGLQAAECRLSGCEDLQP